MALSAAIVAVLYGLGPREEWPYRYRIPAADTEDGKV